MNEDIKKYVLVAINYSDNNQFKVRESDDLGYLITKARSLKQYGYICNIIDTETEENVVIVD